jgi:hypothetical protein
MSRKAVFVAGILLIAGLTEHAAQAHQWGCWTQADRNVKVRNAAVGFYSEARAAIDDWNNSTILNISYVTSGEETYVSNGTTGPTGWGAIVTITKSIGCTILMATVQLNNYYAYNSNAARGAFCDGLGHTFGLDHSNDGGCMGGGIWYDMSTHYYVVSHNVNDIGTLYSDKVLEHPIVGPEADSPRIHAFWANNPRSLGQATRLASDVVVATVDYVTDGGPISIGEDGTLPSQRVHFTVKRSQKGSLSAGQSFVLFQNGNDANRFAEDPSYKVGHRYLLFLTPRPDGTYLVVSPEGRYEVTRNGLVPAAEKGFAADLNGVNLAGVLSDVERALAEFPEQ